MRMRAALAGAAALLLAVPGCADERSIEEGNGTLTVYVSAPLDGPRAADGRAIADGARLALLRAGGEAGAHRIRAVFLDDTGGGESWSLVAAAAAIVQRGPPPVSSRKTALTR